MQVNHATRSRFSDARGALGMGKIASELYGVSNGPRTRKRGEAARARRAAKRAAKRAGVALKAWLRGHR
jgi:hypothetical protein